MRARKLSSTLLGRLEDADAGRVCLGGPPRLGRGRVVVLAARDGRLTGALVAATELPPSEGRPVLLTDEAVGANSEDETLMGFVVLGLVVVDSLAALGLLVEGCLAADAVVGLVSLDVVAADRTAGTRVAGFLGCSVGVLVTAAFAADVARVGAANERVEAFFAGAGALTSLAAGAGASFAASELAWGTSWGSSIGCCSGAAGASATASMTGSSLILGADLSDWPLGVRCKPTRPSFSTATKLVRIFESGRGLPEADDEAPARREERVEVSFQLGQGVVN